jgi:hypothetical protein
MEPEIHALLGATVVGRLGDETIVEEQEGCDECGYRPDPVYHFLDYCFEVWSGDELVGVAGNYAASARLRKAIEDAGLRGVEFEEMIVSKDEEFDVVPPARAEDFPEFHRLMITGRAEGPETWFTSEYCDACGRTIWRETELGLKSAFSIVTGDEPAPRDVYRDSWKRDDAFHLQDPGPPLLTERFTAVLGGLEVKDVQLGPGRWVEPR